MKPYYYIYRVGGNAPTYKHGSASAAVSEAERLAKLHPGAIFEVMKVIAISQVVTPAVTFYMDGEKPAIDLMRPLNSSPQY